ncbi:hypothetical protein [Pseudovibrio sp. Tun.PSC04-5.I4]|uniref:hypothetical protein n=1 Tax=Pseudovibrio sp. Tun.PSC04-5.I4 TaxID=1798213 RepID=UPI0011799961|nr:hypothetical protein [Pseudovibrio sp. Tun.PSC04-5.I4]
MGGCSTTGIFESAHKQTTEYFYVHKERRNWCYTKVKGNEAVAQVCDLKGKLRYRPYPVLKNTPPGPLPAPVIALFDYAETIEKTGVNPQALVR